MPVTKFNFVRGVRRMIFAESEYMRHLRSRALREATIDAYLGWPRRLAKWAGRPLETLTSDDLEAWVGEHDWMPNTHQKATQAVRFYYQWLTATGRIGQDPSANLKPARSPAPVPSPCPEDRYLYALKHASGDTYWRLRLAGDTGLRRAELAAVHSDHVAQLVNGPALIVNGKGGKRRWVPIPEDLAQWLVLQRGYVFANRTGGHIQPHGVGMWYRRTLGIKAHSLRHRYATLAYRSGHDLNAVAALLGHNDVHTTQIYVQVADDDLLRAARGAWTEAA